jgi:hypothetical protein
VAVTGTFDHGITKQLHLLRTRRHFFFNEMRNLRIRVEGRLLQAQTRTAPATEAQEWKLRHGRPMSCCTQHRLKGNAIINLAYLRGVCYGPADVRTPVCDKQT